MFKLTAMVSLYNSGEWIQNRIENLLKSTIINDLEIWCVNANSPDERDDTIPKQYPVKYIRLDERITVYQTWNYIIENSNSEFITNANTDDIVHHTCYEHLIRTLEESEENVGFAYPSWYTTSTYIKHWPTQKLDIGRPGNYNGDLNIGGVGHFPLWRRSLHNKFGLFDDEFRALSDADWWARCYYNNIRFRWIDNNLGCYFWRNGNNLWSREICAEEWDRYHTKLMQYKQIGS
jgi:hypothetical protein